MFIERRLVRRSLLALDGTDTFVRVPEEAVVAVLGPGAHDFIRIDWNGSALRVFAVDLTERTDAIGCGGTRADDLPTLERQGLSESESIQT